MALEKGPFPEETLLEILSHLPVKSLLRFRCVSKPWLSLIASSQFVQLHLKQSIKRNPRILYATYEDTYSIDCTTSLGVPKEYDFPLNGQGIRGSCNGLVCCSDTCYYMELWNPATKESVPIPYAPVDEELIDEEHEVVACFCFDGRDKYKVVRSVFFYRDVERTEFQQCEVKIYTLGTEDWRKIDNPPCCFGNRHMAPQVNGALHWLAGSPIDSALVLDSKIVAFDVGSEKFRIVPWIGAVQSDDTNLEVTLGVLQDRLSALCWYHGEGSICVWSMKDYGVKESWTRLFSVQMPVTGMEFKTIEPLLLLSPGEILLKSSRELYICDTLHNMITVHNICDVSDECYTAHTFVESLVSIASLVHHQEAT